MKCQTATSIQWTISITLRGKENRLSACTADTAMQPMQIWQVLAQWVTQKCTMGA